MCRLVLTVLVIIISVIVLILAIYQCVELSRLSPDADGFAFNVVFGILLLLSFLFIAINGLWGAITGNHRMVASFASSWCCVFILVIILIAVVAAAAANCSDYPNVIGCGQDPWAEVFPRLIFILIFSLISTIIGSALASHLHKNRGQDSCC